MEFDGIVYVSCDFGVVQFDLKYAFGDTISLAMPVQKCQVKRPFITGLFMLPLIMAFDVLQFQVKI
jgi:hypothetical protein